MVKTPKFENGQNTKTTKHKYQSAKSKICQKGKFLRKNKQSKHKIVESVKHTKNAKSVKVQNCVNCENIKM